MSTNEQTPDPIQGRTYNTKKELLAIHRTERDDRRKAEKAAERKQHRAMGLNMVQRKELRRDWNYIEKLDNQEAVEAAEREWYEAVLGLFERNYGEIEGRLYGYKWIFELNVPQDHRAVEKTVRVLTGFLGHYSGRLDNSERFIGWCVDRVTAAFKVTVLRGRFRVPLRSGIWEILGANPDIRKKWETPVQTIDRIEQDAWVRLLQTEAVDKIGDEKGLPAYFYEFGRRQALGSRTDHIRDRERDKITVPYDDEYDPDFVRSARKPSLGELESVELETVA